MKYKVGDRVKIKNDFSYSKDYEIRVNKKMEKYTGRIMTVRKIDNNLYKMQEDCKENIDGWYWSEDMIEGLATFTKSDLKNGDVVTYRNEDKGTYLGDRLINEDGKSVIHINDCNEDLTSKERYYKDLDIIKVERPTSYETVYERKAEILDEAEKRYLRSVIRPFRDRVQNITKWRLTQIDTYFIEIRLKNGETLSFPKFTSKTMYKGMEKDKEYTLEELEL